MVEIQDNKEHFHRGLHGTALKLCCCDVNVGVPIRMRKCLITIDCKILGKAHRHLWHTASYSLRPDKWKKYLMCSWEDDRLLAQKFRWGLQDTLPRHTANFWLCYSAAGFFCTFQKTFGCSFHTVGANSVFWVSYSFWSTELSICLCSVSIISIYLCHHSSNKWCLMSSSFISKA